MNYQKIYDSIILKAISLNRIRIKGGVYYENHHIIPKCLDGSDLKENKVLLIAREHFVCHRLLVEIYPGNKKIFSAYHYMIFTKNSFKNRNYIVSSREYEYVRKIFNENNIGDKNPMFGKNLTIEQRNKISDRTKGNKNPRYGKHLSEEIKNKISKANIGKQAGDKNPMFNKKHTKEALEKISKTSKGRIHSEKTKEKIAESSSGKLHTSETKNKISNSHKGVKFSLEHRKNLSLAKIGTFASDSTKENMRVAKSLQEIKNCTYCDFRSNNSGILALYHGDNCKKNPNYVQIILTCPYCNKTGGSGLKASHFKNCKHKPKDAIQ